MMVEMRPRSNIQLLSQMRHAGRIDGWKVELHCIGISSQISLHNAPACHAPLVNAVPYVFPCESKVLGAAPLLCPAPIRDRCVFDSSVSPLR